MWWKLNRHNSKRAAPPSQQSATYKLPFPKLYSPATQKHQCQYITGLKTCTKGGPTRFCGKNKDNDRALPEGSDQICSKVFTTHPVYTCSQFKELLVFCNQRDLWICVLVSLEYTELTTGHISNAAGIIGRFFSVIVGRPSNRYTFVISWRCMAI